MSAKYQRHPMEAKAEADIKQAQTERLVVKAAFERWLAWFLPSNENVYPFADQAFRAGWTECKAEMERERQTKLSPISAGQTKA